MRILHLSDTHGNFPTLIGKFDIVIHSGDFFPNSQYVFSNRLREMEFQYQWLQEKITLMKEWLQCHDFLFIPGNHDFINPDFMEQLLNSGNIRAINLSNKITNHQGVNFYGFPYIPFINGVWNYEMKLPEMQVEVDKMTEILNQSYVDILVSHSPPHGNLDLTFGNERVGSTIIAAALDYKIDQNMMPLYYLCGHIHSSHGITTRNGMMISNAATTQHIIEI